MTAVIATGASPLLHAAVAALCLGWVALILVCGRGRAGLLLALASLAAAAWAAAVALHPLAPLEGTAGALEIARSGAWLGVLLLLTWRVGGGAARPLALRFALAGVILVVGGLAALLPGAPQPAGLGSPSLLARLGLALLVVLVAENLLRNVGSAARWHVILPCLTLGALSGFDVVLHADAALHHSYAQAMLDARAVLTAAALPLLAVAAARDRRWHRDPPVSRQVVFHGATLVIAGTFLTGVGAVGEGLRHLGADWGQAAQISLLAGALLAIAVAVSSASMRSWLRRLVVDHFFAARFDYRAEWLRCVATLSAQNAEPEQRAITAIADPVDSPAGMLLLADGGPEDGRMPPLRWAGSWNLPSSTLALAADHPLVRELDDGTRIVTAVPEDLDPALGRIWIAVPLRHHRDGLLGLVLLAPPRAPFRLDREAFDLLRAVGREVALFLAERRAAERLHDQRAVAEHAKRFAFVAHDVKNVASQLGLVLANAEDNIADPAFQRDMLLTVGAAAARINALIARLRVPVAASAQAHAQAQAQAQTHAMPGEAAPAPVQAVPGETLRRVLRDVPHPVQLASDDAGPPVAMAAEDLEAALRHLLDNAAEASPPGVPVVVQIRREAVQQGPGRLFIDIIDRGPGMTPEFIRDRLFRPLASGRPGGNGIGAWQARDLLRGAGGDLVAISTPGAGTTMRLTLPCLTAGQDILEDVAA